MDVTTLNSGNRKRLGSSLLHYPWQLPSQGCLDVQKKVRTFCWLAGWLRWLAGCGCTMIFVFTFYSTIPRECWSKIPPKASWFYSEIPWELLNRIAAGSKNCLPVQLYRDSLWLASDSIQQFPGNSWIKSRHVEGNSISLRTAPIQRWI